MVHSTPLGEGLPDGTSHNTFLTGFVVTSGEGDQRLDIYLAKKALALSRSQIQKLIVAGKVRVNPVRGFKGKPFLGGASNGVNDSIVEASYRVYSGDVISIDIPKPEVLQIEPEDIPLEILYEDDALLVVNKPAGIVVHPGAGVRSGTLVNALLYHCQHLSRLSGIMRPGIVHRLDKDTSGLLVVAKVDLSHLDLTRQFREHTIKRRYLALVLGSIPQEEGEVNVPIGRYLRDRKKMAITLTGGRRAVTHFKVLERFSNFTFIEASLETGRTHQIRVHMAYLGYPIVGDTKYGWRKGLKGVDKRLQSAIANLKGQALHAQALGFLHPVTGQYMEFSTPLPRDIDEIICALRG